MSCVRYLSCSHIDTTRTSLTAAWAVCNHPSVVEWPFERIVGGRFGNALHCSSV